MWIRIPARPYCPATCKSSCVHLRYCYSSIVYWARNLMFSSTICVCTGVTSRSYLESSENLRIQYFIAHNLSSHWEYFFGSQASVHVMIIDHTAIMP
ncbi:hypothetical protein Btru_021792 [Bulinus truncatus]|nr:hypothetical protein Btru_021792 [Bulinus truncatus]